MGARIINADLRGAILEDANFSRADLSSAILEDANFEDADLERADLSGAILEDANFEDADLGGANLVKAVLWGANLSQARNLTQQQLDTACGDESTQLPADYTIPMCSDVEWYEGVTGER